MRQRRLVGPANVLGLVALGMLLLTYVAGCKAKAEAPGPVLAGGLKLGSSAFMDGAPIPVEFTCEGADVSPPMAWSGAPAGTRGFALTCFDPDAPRGGWVHWGVYGLPAGTAGLAKGVLPQDARTVPNDFKVPGWRGPCPPPGHGVHHYVFTLYALKAPLSPAPANYAGLEQAAKAASTASARLIGTYERK